MAVLLAWWGKCSDSLWTTNMTRTFLERAMPSSRASLTSLNTSSCIAGPRNWQPRDLTAAHKLALIEFGFWCLIRNSIKTLSATDLTDFIAFTRLSTSVNWLWSRTVIFLDSGLEMNGSVWTKYQQCIKGQTKTQVQSLLTWTWSQQSGQEDQTIHAFRVMRQFTSIHSLNASSLSDRSTCDCTQDRFVHRQWLLCFWLIEWTRFQWLWR